MITPANSYTLDSRPMEGITYLERPALEVSLDSGPTEGITNLERSALGVSLDSGPTEGAPCLEPLEQSVLSSSLAARPVEGVAEKVSDRKPGVNPVQNINPDGRSTYGGDYVPGALGSGGVSGQWTQGGDVKNGTIAIVGS